MWILCEEQGCRRETDPLQLTRIEDWYSGRFKVEIEQKTVESKSAKSAKSADRFFIVAFD
jgi:hypothetical protein